MKTIRYRDRGRILGGILMLCSILFLFLPFIGLSFVAITQGLSPFMAFIYSFPLMGAGLPGWVTFLLILYDLLFLGAFVMPILTGIFILVNKKYFPAFIASIVYGVLVLVWIIVCILVNTGLSYASSMIGAGALGFDGLGANGLSLSGLAPTFLPTLWIGRAHV